MTDSARVDQSRESHSVAKRLRALPPELRTAGIAAACLAVSMLLPWYQKSYVPKGSQQFVQANLSAFGVFSFIEAAVLLVAGGVLFLVWSRANRRAFHLPGGDGTVIFAAGCWVLLLLVWRLFDKPDVADPGGTVGLQWGIFGAFVAAGFLAAAGARVRAAHRPEPPNPAAEDPGRDASPGQRRDDDREHRRPRDASAVTEVLRDRPDWQGEPPEPPSRARPARPDGPADDAPTDRLF
jgi:hypothetical protein